MAIGYGIAVPKPEPIQRTKGRRKRLKLATSHDVHDYVFDREGDICRCCHLRPAESMHEIRPRSLRGMVSRFNSIAVCGSGTTKCHGMLQAHQITVVMSKVGAEGTIRFYPRTDQAADWLLIPVGSYNSSKPERA
jgi:hypothetical protein